MDTCRVPLGKAGHHEAIVSQEDYAAVTKWLWNYKKSRGGGIYARRGGGRTTDGTLRPTILMHVFILETLMGKPRPSDLHTPDHGDRNSLNNTRDNLDWATPSEQGRNRTLPRAAQPQLGQPA